MDILQPKLNRQAAPAAGRLLRERVDALSRFASLASQYPTAGADEIVARLSEQGLSLSGIWGARWLSKRRDRAVRPPYTSRIALPSFPENHSAATQRKDAMQLNRSTIVKPDAALQALNALFARTYYSLARYVEGASPWLRTSDTELWQQVGSMAAEHEDLAIRSARLVIDRRGRLVRGQFPAHFTAKNDLALVHLASELLDEQRRLVAELQRRRIDVIGDPEVETLMDGAIASEQQSLDELQNVVALARQRTSLSDALPTPTPHDAPTSADRRPMAVQRGAESQPHTAA